MSRRSRICLFGTLVIAGLAGCSTYVTEQRPAWRTQAENACLATGAVQESATLVSAREISGPGICGLTHPFKVTALAEGSVTLNSTQTLDCPMIAALDVWLKDVVQPAALARFGERVRRINSMGSYSCRGINNMSGAHLSEHAFGNALDIGGFVLESGRELNIMRGFNGADEQERAFLHEAHAGACGYFTTVLGPGYNVFHYNHIHVDLAMHGGTSRGPRRYCKPVPQTNLPEPPRKDDLPDPPAIEEELDIARAPLPARAIGAEQPTIVASVPPPPLPLRTAPVERVPASLVARVPDEPASRPSGLISFAGPPGFEDADASAPTVRRVTARPRRAPPVPGAPVEADSMPADGRGDPGRDMADGARSPRFKAAPSGDTAPADWDLTSSVRPGR